MRTSIVLITLTLALVTSWAPVAAAPGAAEPVALAAFDVDVTPPLGTMMAYDPVRRIDEMGLRARGVVILGSGAPIVLCAVDWIGIANEGQDRFRETLAAAARTVPGRVAVHTVHQHDAPGCDFTAERLLREAGSDDLGRYEGTFARAALTRLEAAVRAAMRQPRTVTHAGFGSAEVREVASNRRIPGPDGRIRATRYTSTKNPALRAEPEGVVDRAVSVIGFWDGDEPVAVLSYYACHPQSYYRMSIPSPDFPGIARFMRGQSVPTALHIHFNGAGGNIGAGKYNDGARENRVALATRLADGMRRAFDAARPQPLTAADVGWSVEPVALPVATHLDPEKLRAELASGDARCRLAAADTLAWVTRCAAGHRIEIACLRIGDARVLHMPGELFVEYQIAAKAMRPDLRVALAAYGDYAPGYIGTEKAYAEGGYETSPRASNVAPECERVLTGAMRRLLVEPPSR